MQKNNFLSQLQKRATEQQVVMSGMPLPGLFVFVSRVFGESPWRILVPLSIVLSILFQLVWKNTFDNTVLWLFGSL